MHGENQSHRRSNRSGACCHASPARGRKAAPASIILNPKAPDFEEQYWALRRIGARFRVNHHSWWKQELPSKSEYEEARRNLERIHYEVDYVITHCAPSSIVDILGNGGYVYDHLTDFLEDVRERAKFHYWLFGHYHDNRIIDDRFVLLWEQMVQVV